MNFAIVGTNFISDRFADAAKESGAARIVAVYSRAKESGVIFSAKHNIPCVFTDYEEMLCDDGIDAIYIASPTMCHKEQAIAAMKHGKAVLCEKMITATACEFYELKAAKEKYGGFIIEAMRCDFDPILGEVKKRVADIGKIKEAHFDFCQYSSRYDDFKNGIVRNAFDPKMKNSSLADIGIYPLHFCIDIFGMPNEVKSKSHFLKNGFEGAGEIILTYADSSARITYSKIHESENVSRIVGAKGYISFGKINEPPSMTLHKEGCEDEVIKAPRDSSNMRAEIQQFVQMYKSNKKRADELFELSGRVMKVVDAVYNENGIKF